MHWLESRFSKKKANGLILTLGLILAALFLLLFLGIAASVVSKQPIIQFDQFILQSVPNYRTPALTLFFSFVTFLGNWQSIVFVSVITTIFFLYKKQNFSAVLFLLNLLIGEAIIYFLKIGIGRARPDKLLQIITETSFSFPSGHAFASSLVLGFLTYFIFKYFKQLLPKTLTVLSGVLVILLICLSRIYFGVHYPSDVLASLALGSFLLSIFITVAEINEKYFVFRKQPKASLNYIIFIPLLLLIFSLILNSTFIIITANT